MLRLPGRRWFQEMLIGGPIVGNRMMEAAERGRPKLHAVQIRTQVLKRFDQVPNNQIFCGFRHCFWAFVPSRTFLLLES